VRYRAGQYFFLTIRVAGEEAIHHFSFSSSPTEKGYIEFTKRITSSDFSQTLNILKPGDWARLNGPDGSFVLPAKPRPIAFLSGGIGITPLRSMLRYITDKNLAYDVVLIYGNSTPEEIVFKQELDEIQASNPLIRVEHVLSRPTVSDRWKGKRGYINKDLIVELLPDYRGRLFYISGPPKMVISLEEQLTSLDIPGKQLKRDSFTGYD